MPSYKLSLAAKEDLYRIWQYGLENYGLKQANDYLDGLEKHFEVLAQSPYAHPSVDEIRQGYRRSICNVESVYYRIVDDGVEIMAILGRQDADDWL